MPKKTIYIYSDASFNKELNLAVIGFGLFKSSEEHETLSLDQAEMQLLQIKESNNIRAEIKAALLALNFYLKTCDQKSQVLMFSDCHAIINLPTRRKKLEENNFISQGKKKLLNNADLYQEFYKLYDVIKPELQWVKGHSPKKMQISKIQNNFSILDKEVRKKLRSLSFVSKRDSFK